MLRRCCRIQSQGTGVCAFCSLSCLVVTAVTLELSEGRSSFNGLSRMAGLWAPMIPFRAILGREDRHRLHAIGCFNCKDHLLLALKLIIINKFTCKAVLQLCIGATVGCSPSPTNIHCCAQRTHRINIDYRDCSVLGSVPCPQTLKTYMCVRVFPRIPARFYFLFAWQHCSSTAT